MTRIVSVIMPAFNMSKYISQSIQSVMNQNFNNWELLIVDDGSEDSTADICRLYEQIDGRIRFFSIKKSGVSAARNYAIERSRGDLLAFLDSDDLWLPNKLSVSVTEFEQEDQDLLFTNGYNFTDTSDLTKIHQLQKFPLHVGLFHGESGVKKFIKVNRVHTLTVLVKKDVVNKLGGFPPFRFGEDYCLWILMLLSNYKLRGIDCALSLYRERPESALHSEKKVFVQLFEVFKFIIQKHPDIIKHRKEFKNFLKLYITFDYEQTNKEQLREMMETLRIKNPVVNHIFNLNKVLPERMVNKLSRTLLV